MKKLYCIMSALLALGICLPGGAMQAMAEEIAAPAQAVAGQVEGAAASAADGGQNRADEAPDASADASSSATESAPAADAAPDRDPVADAAPASKAADASGAAPAVAADAVPAAASAAELQQRIDEAPDGGTVVIAADLALDKTVVVPAGKSVTLTDDGSARTVSSTAEPMFQVDGTLAIAATADANLVFKGAATGAEDQGSIATVTGTLDLRGGTLNGGPVNGIYEGALVMLGGTFDMSGGVVSNQERAAGTHVSTAAIIAKENASGQGSVFNLSGGTIADNRPASGASIILSHSALAMSGGSIERNSGGIVATAHSTVELSGGTIANNDGSGIHLNSGTGLTMTGGTISGNRASGSGGGIYAQAVENLDIRAGSIVDNTAGNFGGGIYIDSTRVTARIDGALVADNTATLMGGGLWCCPTSQAVVNVTDGMAVFDNAVSGDPAAGADFANLDQSANEGAVVAIAERMLGGGLNAFYNDGGILYNPAGHGFWGKWDADPAAPRFDAANPGDPVSVDGTRVSRALKSLPSNEAKAAARAAATTIIAGNTAKSGGGIATNGSFASGTAGEWELAVSKVWDDAIDASLRESVPVYLVIDGTPLDYAMLTAENGYRASFKGLPDPSSVKSVAVVEGSIAEDGTVSPDEPTDRWQVVYGGIDVDAQAKTMSATVTNKPLLSIPVEKKWVGSEAGPVTVHLFADGVDTGKQLVLSADTGWKGSFDGVPSSSGDKQAAYTVVEDAVEGYVSEVSGDAASGFVVTNTKQTTPPNPGGGTPGKPAPTPQAKMPATGDGAPAGVAAGMAVAALAALTAGLAARRRA